MSTVPTRGSWTVDEAVVTRWNESELDQAVRNEWPIASRLSTKYQTLHDTLARPIPPGPYVVFEKMTPFIRGHMSGSSDSQRENQFQQVLIQFSIHAQSITYTSGILESGKSRVIRLAKLVAKEFDPETNPWTMYDDSMILVTREPDFHIREGEDEWVWVLQYSVLIDAEYSQV